MITFAVTIAEGFDESFYQYQNIGARLMRFAVIRTLRGAASRADEASMDVDETDRGARHESTGQSHSALPNSRAAAGLGRAKKAKAEDPCP